MGEDQLHSLVPAADHRVADAEEMSTRLKARQSNLAPMDARHVAVYTSLWKSGRVPVTIGVRRPNSIREALGSSAAFELFDKSSPDEIPALFPGEQRAG